MSAFGNIRAKQFVSISPLYRNILDRTAAGATDDKSIDEFYLTASQLLRHGDGEVTLYAWAQAVSVAGKVPVSDEHFDRVLRALDVPVTMRVLARAEQPGARAFDLWFALTSEAAHKRAIAKGAVAEQLWATACADTVFRLHLEVAKAAVAVARV